jgi:hypothetical protein
MVSIELDEFGDSQAVSGKRLKQKINVAELDAHTSRARWRLVGEFRFPAAGCPTGRQRSHEVRGKKIRCECQIAAEMNRRLDLDEK